MYDRDSEGLKEYGKLGGNFTKHIKYDAMYHRNGRSAAFLIPIPSDRQEYAKAENLKLEFLFNDEYLTKEVDGYGLKLLPKMVCRRIERGPTLFPEPAPEPQYRNIEGNKMYFAEKIVPILPGEAFFRFAAIFDLFESILNNITEKQK